MSTTTQLLKPYENHLTKPQFNHFSNFTYALSVCEIPSINRFSHLFDSDRSTMNRFLTESPWEIEPLKLEYHKQISEFIPKKSFLLIDDTLSRRPYAKKVQKANYHYDHTNNKQSLGYCIVTSTISWQDTVLPYDMVPYYRKIDCDKNQFISKNEITKNIILSTKNNYNINTILFDTWFSNKIVIGACKEANKNYITQIKSNRNVTINRHENAVRAFVKEIDKWSEFEFKDDKFRIFATSAFISKIGSIHLIFSQMYNDKTEKWGGTFYIITNQLNIESVQVIKDYLRRGGIESFHREAKQNTGLEGYFLRNNRGIERYLFLVMLTYAFLVLQGLENEKLSIGKLCEENKMVLFERSFDMIIQKPGMKREICRRLAKARV